MSLRHVLLGALAEPASGYDLKQGFVEGMRLFWSAELSQIYPELKRMEAEGLVRSEQQPSTKGPTRRVYQRTEAGTEALESWLLSGPDFGVERNPIVAQVFFLSTLDQAAQIRHLQALHDAFSLKLKALDQVANRWAEKDPRFPDRLPPDLLTRHFALTAGQRRMTMMMDWCLDCIERLDSRPTIQESEKI